MLPVERVRLLSIPSLNRRQNDFAMPRNRGNRKLGSVL
jgi:hypothetical protein